MSKISIEHNPSEERLKELGVSNWEIWEKEISKFPIDFDETEGKYLDLNVADFNFFLTIDGKPITEIIRFEPNEDN